MTKPSRFWKRSFDVLLGGAALVVLSPVMLLIALCVKLALGSPVLFRQVRPGLHETPFTIYKFRTMKLQTATLPDEMRITRFGRLLRQASLDELPELWNVICGDMSLVGPRPLLVCYLDRYSPGQRRRHEVLPGITGWAQVNGRNAITWEERLAMDVWYVDHQSFWLDLRILWMTLGRIIRRDGISHRGHVTMPEFTGDNDFVSESHSGCTRPDLRG